MSERKNITQPASWWEAFRKAANEENKSLSEWVGECCFAFLKTEQQNKLETRPNVGKPKAAAE